MIRKSLYVKAMKTITVLEFAGTTKVFRQVNNGGAKQHLQDDPDKLVKWSEK